MDGAADDFDDRRDNVADRPGDAPVSGPRPVTSSELEVALEQERQRNAELSDRLARSMRALQAQRLKLEELRTANADLTIMAAAVDHRIQKYERAIAERDQRLASHIPAADVERLRGERERLEAEVEALRAQSLTVHAEMDRLARAESETAASDDTELEAARASAPDGLDEAPSETLVNPAVAGHSYRRHYGVAAAMVSVMVFALWLTGHTWPGLSTTAEGSEGLRREEVAAADGSGAAAAVEKVPEKSAEELAREAEQLFEQGDLNGAAAAAEKATRLEPRWARHYRLLGYIYAALGSEHEATANLARAAELEPNLRVSLADYHMARAWVDLEEESRRRPDDAAVAQRLRALAEVAEINPELRAISRIAAPHRPLPAVEMVPPLVLTEQGDTALVVEKRIQTARLYRWREGHLEVAASYPVTTGATPGTKEKRGDRRTPDGIYAVTDLLPGDDLPNRYGALAMPLSYPNAFDRLHKREGYGIWIHGADNINAPFNPRGTRGCVTLRPEDLRELARTIDPVITPVLIAEEIPYVRSREWTATISRLGKHIPMTGVVNLVAGSDYVAVTRRDGDAVVREFLQPQEPFGLIASERAEPIGTAAWEEKLTRTSPQSTASLVSVRLGDDASNAIVIETSLPSIAKGLNDDADGDLLYIDLIGVQPGMLPKTIAGRGDWVKQVRIGAAEIDPPITRLVVEMRKPAKHRIATSGNRTTVSFSGG